MPHRVTCNLTAGLGLSPDGHRIGTGDAAVGTNPRDLDSLGGKCVVNSVNFEDGDGPNSRYQRMMPLVAEHGAGVVALCIDEEGQARDRDWKVRIAARLIEDLGLLGVAVFTFAETVFPPIPSESVVIAARRVRSSSSGTSAVSDAT